MVPRAAGYLYICICICSADVSALLVVAIGVGLVPFLPMIIYYRHLAGNVPMSFLTCMCVGPGSAQVAGVGGGAGANASVGARAGAGAVAGAVSSVTIDQFLTFVWLRCSSWSWQVP